MVQENRNSYIHIYRLDEHFHEGLSAPLRRVTTWLRSTMSTERLFDLYMVSVHRHKVMDRKDATIKDVTDSFGSERRRLQFLFSRYLEKYISSLYAHCLNTWYMLYYAYALLYLQISCPSLEKFLQTPLSQWLNWHRRRRSYIYIYIYIAVVCGVFSVIK